MNRRHAVLFMFLTIILQACASAPPPKEMLALTDSQLKIRSFQTRVFDLNDQDMVLRGVLAALQDLGFIVERANGPMGLITAGKFGNGQGIVELTVTVRAKGEQQTEVRLNAIFNTQPIEDPEAYQNFFTAVERSLFISKG